MRRFPVDQGSICRHLHQSKRWESPSHEAAWKTIERHTREAEERLSALETIQITAIEQLTREAEARQAAIETAHNTMSFLDDPLKIQKILGEIMKRISQIRPRQYMNQCNCMCINISF